MKEIIEKLRAQTGDPDGDFNSALLLGADTKKVYLIPFNYRKKKKDGSYTHKKYEMNIQIKYNPFTGEPLAKSDD